MTKGHSLKIVFARIRTRGVSTFYEEGQSGRKKHRLCTDSALDHAATNQYNFEKVNEDLISTKFSASYLHELCYFYKHSQLKYRQKSLAPTKPYNCVFKHNISLRKWSIERYVSITQVQASYFIFLHFMGCTTWTDNRMGRELSEVRNLWLHKSSQGFTINFVNGEQGQSKA